MAKKKKTAAEVKEELDKLGWQEVDEDWDAFSQRVHEENYVVKSSLWHRVKCAWYNLQFSVVGFSAENWFSFIVVILGSMFAFFSGIATQAKSNVAERVMPSYFCSAYAETAVEATLQEMVDAGYSYEDMVKTAHSQKDPCYKYFFEASLQKHLDAVKERNDLMQGWLDYLDTHPKPVVAEKQDKSNGAHIITRQ